MSGRPVTDTLATIEGVEGWLTDDQALRLRDAAASAPVDGATLVEIGSFRGRSSIVLAGAAPHGASMTCIDPHAGSDRGPQEIAPDADLGDADHAAFNANLVRAGVADRIRHVRAFSGDPEARAAVRAPIDVLYVDGAHRYGPALADLRDWGDRVAPGGRMLVHDTFSSVGVTLAVLRQLCGAPGWHYAGRTGTLTEWERRGRPASARERAADAVAVTAQVPWFVRNLVVKVLILARLRPLARVLGHGPADGPWPY